MAFKPLVLATCLLAAFELRVLADDVTNNSNGDMSVTDKVIKTDAEWKQILTPMQYKVLREHGTERPGTGEYDGLFADGRYVCAACSNELFNSQDKFDAGCGWPSFSRSRNDGALEEKSDHSLGMKRTEVLCSRCGGHLGHVFDDGPNPTGLRYCMNSAALKFEATPATTNTYQKATFAEGCFWCTEAVFDCLDGVITVEVGYMGGKEPNPDYEAVCTGESGHAEVAEITFDPAKISYSDLLDVFWETHNPTSLNQQGADRGTQYRSAIFYHSDEQKLIAEKSKAALNEKLKGAVVTEIVPAGEFFTGEQYHQDYFRKNPEQPYCQMIIAPKLKKLKKKTAH